MFSDRYGLFSPMKMKWKTVLNCSMDCVDFLML